LLLISPFAHYGSFFALAGGALSNSTVMAFNFDAFSSRLLRHLNRTQLAFFKEKLFGIKH